MRKHAVRLAIAILTCCIGTAVSYLSKWAIEAFYFSQTITCPYSVLEGTTVRILPYNATFEILEGWLTPDVGPEPAKNLYLSRLDLNTVYWNDGGDAEDAQVMNAVLPFEACAAHFGDRGWGNYFWNDLQGRVYVVDLTPEELATRIGTRGLEESANVFEGVSLSRANYDVWQKLTLEILDAPTHFMLMKNLDFYYRPIGNKTVVFVFLHAGGFDPTIHRILDSFEPNNSSAQGD